MDPQNDPPKLSPATGATAMGTPAVTPQTSQLATTPALPPMSSGPALPVAPGTAGLALSGTLPVALNPALPLSHALPSPNALVKPNPQGAASLPVSLAQASLSTASLAPNRMQASLPMTGLQGVKGVGVSGGLPVQQLQSQHHQSSQGIGMAAGAGYVVRAPGQGGRQAVEPKKQLKETDALEYLNKVKLQFGENPVVYNRFLDIMKDFKSHAIDTQKVIERVSKLFAGHQSLILGFNTFLPPGYKIEIRSAPPKPKAAPEFDHAYSYVSKIKARFAVRQDVYQKFLTILQRYKEEGFAITQVKAQVAELFAGHEDLLAEFGNFLPDPAAKSAPANKAKKSRPAPSRKDDQAAQQQASQAKKEDNSHGSKDPNREKTKKSSEPKKNEDAEMQMEIGLMERLKKKLLAQGPNCYTDFLKCLSLFVQDVLSSSELLLVLEDMMNAPGVREVYEEFKLFLGLREGSTKYRTNIPMSEIDFTDCPSCGTSYRSLPKDYPLPLCSGRTELCDKVMNDEWVSVPSGSEDYNYTHYRKNQYEESLFKCEDDRFELDMLIETNASAIRVIEPLLEEAEKDRSRSARINITALRAIHYKAIERVYGDHGPEIVEHVRRAPRVALNVVLPRLRHKDEEWRKARRDMNKIWREVYKDNYYKSLDHRSFYFKQVDKKGLSAKSFLQEIRTAQESGISSSNPSPYLAWGMDRLDIHRDILEVVGRSAASELLEGAEARVRKFFYAFLHVFLGLGVRNLEDIKNRARVPKREKEPGAQERKGSGKGKEDKARKNVEKMDEDGEEEEMDGEGKAMDVDEEGAGGEGAEAGDDGEDAREDTGEKDSKGVEEEEEEEGKEDKEAEEEEEEEEEEDLWQAVHSMFPHFVPITTYIADRERDHAKHRDSKVATPNQSTHVFYGNLSCYVFFRLYQKLYERLSKAAELASEMQAREEQATANKDAPEVHGASRRDDPQSASAEGPRLSVYERFRKMLLELVDGTIDTSKFEDDCRMLLGTNSYELYTLEKVVEKLLTQVQSMTTESSVQSASKLLALHEYEHVRAGVDTWEDIAPLDYFGNASCLTGEEGCFGFFWDTKAHALTVAMMHVKDSGGKTDARLEKRREEWFDEILASPQLRQGPPPSSFLRRNLASNSSAPAVWQSNGLELQYGEERVKFAWTTTDCMIRPGSKPTAPRPYNANRRAVRLSKWLEERLEKIPAEAEEEQRKAALEAARKAAEEEDEEEEEEEREEEEGEGDAEDGEEDGEEGGDEGDDGEDGEGEEDGEEVEEGGGLEQLMQAGERGSEEAMADVEQTEEAEPAPPEGRGEGAKRATGKRKKTESEDGGGSEDLEKMEEEDGGEEGKLGKRKASEPPEEAPEKEEDGGEGGKPSKAKEDIVDQAEGAAKEGQGREGPSGRPGRRSVRTRR